MRSMAAVGTGGAVTTCGVEGRPCGGKKWVALVVRAHAGYDEVWEPCWNASSVDPELGYFDALRGSD